MSSSDRRPYETATTLDQSLLNECAENLVCDLRMICNIDVPTGSFPTNTLYLSDRNMVVGTNFYSARVKFPVIKRTVGEILTPVVKFSTQTIQCNNSDGYFNSILPGGANYDSFINRRLTIKIGLAEEQNTFDSNIVFDGFVTEVGGFSRDMSSFTIVARDKFDDLNETFPNTVFTASSYPDIEDGLLGQPKPIIIGDWTTNIEETKGSSIPSLVVNSLDEDMNGSISHTNNVQLVISENTNNTFDNTSVILVRSSIAYTIDSADISNISVSKNSFEIVQNGTTTIDGSAYTFKSSDKFYCRVKGQEIDGGNVYPDNAVEQARYILVTFAGASPSNFSSNWDTLRDKNSPAQSAIVNIKSRVYVQKPEKILMYALSMLEQIRCEAFINRNQEIDIATNHWEDFDDSPSIILREWDIERGSFKPRISDRNNFNRVQSFFNNLPELKQNYQATTFFKQQDSINQSKDVGKGLVFPNLYILSDVENQTKEYLKFTCGFREDIIFTTTWKFLLMDLDDWISVSVNIGGTIFDGVPARIRDMNFSSKGMKVSFRCWSMQMLPFELWQPGYNGIVGGQNAVIT